MEEDSYSLSYRSKLLQKATIQKQLDALKNYADEAGELQDYEKAHNPENLYALDIIEQFLRKRGRVCYGGTAINAILPKSLQFYDKNKTLPDYDFYTPDLEGDIHELLDMLESAGFKEVNQRVGIHDGTKKILVNFVPVADISSLEKPLYEKIYNRSVVKAGIHYCDANFLRMLMYLEISRPKGQTTRWEKVFERLTLLNKAFPIKQCYRGNFIGKQYIPSTIREVVLRFIIQHGRILLGAEVAAIYDMAVGKGRFKSPSINWFLKRKSFLLFYSPDVKRDADILEEIIDLGDDLKRVSYPAFGDISGRRIVLEYKGVPIVGLIEENACHSYNTLNLRKEGKLLIGSLDTLITLYLWYEIFTASEEKRFLGYPILCLCQKLIEMDEQMRKKDSKGRSPFPAFSLECSGYQKGFPTLLREKAKRIEKEKEKLKALKTRSRSKSSSKRNQTRKLS